MDRQSVRQLILWHISRRPEMEAQDVYKFLFQGVFGVGHILTEKAWERLIEESERINIEDHKEDQLTESVSPDGDMIRVNLRPFLRKKLDLEKLYDVMIISARVDGSKDIFLDYWNEFKSLVEEDNLDFDWNEINEIDVSLNEDGPISRHHTEKYREAYYPAYRVVQKQVFFDQFPTSVDD